jgi:putative tryptophan/tyrosine transport system substrate-binding protein
MTRREFITLLGGATVACPIAARGQEAGRTYRVGGLSVSPRTAQYIVAMFDEVRRLGFIEGRNLTVDWRGYGLRPDLLSEFAAELVKADVDVIYAVGHSGIRAAQRATTTIPILGSTDDMVGEGLVDSMARPNGNTTGISIFATELNGKRLEILIEAVPGLRRMAALTDSETRANAQLDALQEAARARDVELSIHRIARPEEIPANIDAAKASGAEALNVLSSAILYGSRQIVMQHVAALRLPAIYPFPEAAAEGGFLGYGPRLIRIYRDVLAPQLVKLLRGAESADIPVEQPTKFELAINLKTAKVLGVTIPESFLLRADNVIE